MHTKIIGFPLGGESDLSIIGYSHVRENGEIVLPKQLIKEYNINENSQIVWMKKGDVVFINIGESDENCEI